MALNLKVKLPEAVQPIAPAPQAPVVVKPTLPPTLKPSGSPAFVSTLTEASTILDHLTEWRLHRSKETLMLIKKTTDEAYTVLGYSIDEQKVTLTTPLGGTISPKIGLREVPQYYCVYR